PAAACWLVYLLVVNRSTERPGALLVADAAGLLAGGSVAVGLGTWWLVASGAWPYFIDIMLGWNSEYYVGGPLARIFLLLYPLAPWSLMILVAVPLAVGAVISAMRYLARSILDQDTTARYGRMLLSAVYLGWLLQAACLQLPHPYVVAPLVLLGMTL